MKTKRELLKLLVGKGTLDQQIDFLWKILNAANDEAIIDYQDLTDLIDPPQRLDITK